MIYNKSIYIDIIYVYILNDDSPNINKNCVFSIDRLSNQRGDPFDTLDRRQWVRRGGMFTIATH